MVDGAIWVLGEVMVVDRYVNPPFSSIPHTYPNKRKTARQSIHTLTPAVVDEEAALHQDLQLARREGGHALFFGAGINVI